MKTAIREYKVVSAVSPDRLAEAVTKKLQIKSARWRPWGQMQVVDGQYVQPMVRSEEVT